MQTPLRAARIGNERETQRQSAHLLGIEHDLGGSCELKAIAVGVGQSSTGIATQGANKDPFGGLSLIAVAFPGASIPLGQPQFNPVGRTIDPAMEAPGINKGLQQQQRMTEACLPIGHDPMLGQRQHP